MTTTNKKTTRVCWHCGSTVLVLLWSTREKLCADCHGIVPWYLEPGQKPLIGPARTIKGANS